MCRDTAATLAASRPGGDDLATGSFLSLKGLAKNPVVRSRLIYLCINLSFVVLDLLYGAWVYYYSRSLTVRVDVYSAVCEAAAVLINMLVEVCKLHQVKPRNIMILDLVGGVLSLLLLAAIGIIGAVEAMKAKENLEHISVDDYIKAYRLHDLLHFSAFTCVLSFINLRIFSMFSPKMLPRDGDTHDQLNILSSLAHSVIDFITSLSVLGTALWITFGVSDGNSFVMARHKLWVDLIGSYLVCGCILVSILFLFGEIVRCIEQIRNHSDDDSGANDLDALQDSTVPSYGTVEKECVDQGLI